MKWVQGILLVLIFAAFLWLYTLVGLTFVNHWSTPQNGEVGDVLFHSNQPKDINYHSQDPYKILVTRQISRIYPFSATNYATIHIMHKGESRDDYMGWSMDIGVSGQFSTFAAKWTDSGIELTTNDTVRHFFPKALFIGGR